MIIRTNNLNKAAFFTSFGAVVIDIEGKYPDQVFVIQSSKLVFLYEKYIGLVSYRRYTNQRIRLKRKGRKKSGLPMKFTGDDMGFKLGDMAIVRAFTKSEIESFK